MLNKSHRVLNLPANVAIVVPDSLSQLTTYVLVEQDDWFEDEIKFLRILLQPGDQTIDIGANLGVYSLTMAACVGKAGQVWAFEPVPETLDFLRESVALNGFHQMTVVEAALTATEGIGHMATKLSSELNTLSFKPKLNTETRKVAMKTIDRCATEFGWDAISFIKIDAEGHESEIFKGGKEFFSKNSPLVQFEVQENPASQEALLSTIRQFGFDIYRLIPGLGVLVPLESESHSLEYQLNLFACKPDRADRLASRGLLVRDRDLISVSRTNQTETGWSDSDQVVKDWLNSMVSLPYSQKFCSFWEAKLEWQSDQAFLDMLVPFARSRDSRLDNATRIFQLGLAFQAAKTLVERKPSLLRQVWLGRISREFGHRRLAVNAFYGAIQEITKGGQLVIEEPFIPPNKDYEHLAINNAFGPWLYSGLSEELERCDSFSSYFSLEVTQRRLGPIQTLGFCTPEMKRRFELSRLIRPIV